MSNTNKTLNINTMFTREELQEAHELEQQQLKAAKQRSKKAKREARRTALVPYLFKPSDNFPKAGEVVADCHQSVQDAKGNARLQRAAVEFRKVAQVYLSDSEGFRIKMNNGDIAHVRPASVGSAKWETFIKGEKQRVVVK